MIEDSWDFGWQEVESKKIFSKDEDDRNLLITKNRSWKEN